MGTKSIYYNITSQLTMIFQKKKKCDRSFRKRLWYGNISHYTIHLGKIIYFVPYIYLFVRLSTIS